MAQARTRLLLFAALLTLSFATVSRAAGWVELTVDIAADPGKLTVRSSLDAPPLNGIQILVLNGSGFSFLPIPTLSIRDSVYSVDPLGDGSDALILWGNVLTPLLSPGQELVVGHFQPFDLNQFTLLPGDEAFGATLFGPDFSVIPWSSAVSGTGFCDPYGHVGCQAPFLRLTVPEPASTWALALAALALSAAGRSGAARRRSARPRSA